MYVYTYVYTHICSHCQYRMCPEVCTSEGAVTAACWCLNSSSTKTGIAVELTAAFSVSPAVAAWLVPTAVLSVMSQSFVK